MANAPIRSGRPTVVFADDFGWASFDQVAAALRHQGVRTVRVMSREPAQLKALLKPPHLRWLTDRIAYDRMIVLSRPGGEAQLMRLLASGRVADVIATEPSLLTIGLDTPAGRALTAKALAFRGADAGELLDKFWVNERLAEAGLLTPEQVLASDLTPAQAARRFGLPLVIKDAIGAGGDQVRIAHSTAEIRQALEALERPGARLFYQAHVPGRMVIYASVWGPEGPRIEHGVAIGKSQYTLGPASTIHMYDHPELLAAGRRAAERFGCQGFVSFGFMETADHRFFQVDANIRPWGMIMAPLALGIDFVRPYAALVKGRAWRAAPAEAPDERELGVFPHALYQAVRTGSRGQAVDAWSEFLTSFWGTAGPAYCLHTSLRAGLSCAGRLRRIWRERAARPVRRPAQAAATAPPRAA